MGKTHFGRYFQMFFFIQVLLFLRFQILTIINFEENVYILLFSTINTSYIHICLYLMFCIFCRLNDFSNQYYIFLFVHFFLPSIPQPIYLLVPLPSLIVSFIIPSMFHILSPFTIYLYSLFSQITYLLFLISHTLGANCGANWYVNS